ncbi:hypothetical protein [Campylobacter sp. RM16188]|uniref:hypothetical protein n=1 Tax=Campylobacter sp. RM16188 TaxID=1705725 RepID=UPI0020A61D70|nr:hypothetical protein [Campylobacter sp. RM16188]
MKFKTSKSLTTKQRMHIDNLVKRRRDLYQERLNSVLSYDLDYYRFKNGKLNISKMARCTGFSRSFLTKHLWFKGL